MLVPGPPYAVISVMFLKLHRATTQSVCSGAIFGTTSTMTKPNMEGLRRRRRPRPGHHLALISATAIGVAGTEVLAYTPSPLIVPRPIRNANYCIRRTSSSSGPGPGPLRSTAGGLSDLSPTSTTRPAAEVAASSTTAGTAAAAASSSSANQSRAALWHKHRRRQMLNQYGDQIIPLERDASSQSIGVPLLLLSNAALLTMAVWAGTLSPLKVLGLAAFPGSMLSLWQLQILHDALHGSLLDKSKTKFMGGRISRKSLQDFILFWGSMPSAFGYYLYLQFGHMSHHRSVGDPDKASLAKLFDSDQVDFEDGDVLFVAHRMKLKGEVGPTFTIPPLREGGKTRKITMSISKMGFNAWRKMKPIRNVMAFATSFAYERFMLVINDAVVALSGRNFFFPNKPDRFHRECATYCRCAVAVRALLVWLAGWKSLLFLYLSELLWSIPPHPAAAMFVTNHGSAIDETTGDCIPSSSTYAGGLYSLYTLGTNYHVEHHDFPTIPFHRLHLLRKIAPEFYRQGSGDDLFGIMRKAFSDPQYYACMDAANM